MSWTENEYGDRYPETDNSDREQRIEKIIDQRIKDKGRKQTERK